MPRYMEYEELPLFIHPNFREVIVHHDGHKPPILKKEQAAPRRKECVSQCIMTWHSVCREVAETEGFLAFRMKPVCMYS